MGATVGVSHSGRSTVQGGESGPHSPQPGSRQERRPARWAGQRQPGAGLAAERALAPFSFCHVAQRTEVGAIRSREAAVRAFQDQAPAAEDLLRRGKAQAQMRFAAGNLTEALDALGKSQGLSAYTEVVVDRWAGHAAAWLGAVTCSPRRGTPRRA